MPSDVGDVARILQRGLAPTVLPEVAGLSVAARYRADGFGEVGGDWYDVLNLPSGDAAVVIGDVAGHGVAAATTMAHLRHSLRAYLCEDASPASVLSRLNRMAQWILPGEIATAIVAVFDAEARTVVMASAGHLPPLAVGGAQASYLELSPGPALGVANDPAYAETVREFNGDVLLFFTDGLIERRGESIDEGLARLATASPIHEWGPPMLDRLIDDVHDPAGGDDLAVIAVRPLEPR